MSHAIFMLGSKIAIGSLVFEILVLEYLWKRLNIQSFTLILLHGTNSQTKIQVLEHLVNITRFLQINENLNLLLLVINYLHCWY